MNKVLPVRYLAKCQVHSKYLMYILSIISIILAAEAAIVVINSNKKSITLDHVRFLVIKILCTGLSTY